MFEIKKEKFPEKEERILNFWKEMDIFNRSLQEREGAPTFCFYDGPPFATGLPHYGHLMAGTIKDVIPRYKTMKGFFVPRRFGWDCHGLPVENEIEKTQALSGAYEIQDFGIAKFNGECRSIVLRYTSQWKYTIERMGRWIDMEYAYRTMDRNFMESVWWVFGQLWEKDLVYKGFKVMPYSTKLGTPLSNFEANLNYQEVDDPAVTVKMPTQNPGEFFLIWTTTPWTLPSNLALIVNPDIEYARVKSHINNDFYIVAKKQVTAHFKDSGSYEIHSTCRGKDLIGKKYTPPFSYFIKERPDAFRVIGDDFVGEDNGTGIVHAAPAFGEEDFFVCLRENIEIVCPVDNNGKFTSEVPEYAGLFVKDADKQIIQYLKREKLLFHQATIRHRYPFCWRSDTPLIYKAVDSWFVAVEKIKDRLIEINHSVHWVPEHMREGRFGKWLENARDWAVSRNRYWGTPLPIWKSEENDYIVISSVAELERLSQRTIPDIHRHHIDDIIIHKDGKEYKRISEVFDCWFESGSMPYAQIHYPFENKDSIEKRFPADFIAEGIDQTRGWFYTLMVLSTALFDTSAFKNVVVNGLILAEDGRKMSKKLKNYPEPSTIIDAHGADALRFYLLRSAAVRGEDMRFSERDVETSVRQLLLPLWNCYVFFATYADIYKWEPITSGFPENNTPIDRWIISKLQKLISEVEGFLEQYHLSNAVESLVEFIESLTNWYIRRNRRRFWEDSDPSDQQLAFGTLYSVLYVFAQISAPFIPFISEEIYQNLRRSDDPISVHLTTFPLYNASLRDLDLEEKTALAQTVVNLGHSLRKENHIKVRQPLQAAYVACRNEATIASLQQQENLIKEELNVKEIHFSGEESQFVMHSIKPNLKILGKKVGKWLPKLREKIQTLTYEEASACTEEDPISIAIDGNVFPITQEDLLIESIVQQGIIAKVSEGITVALDLDLNEALIEEGIARELVNRLNAMRKALGLQITDRIRVTLDTTEKVRKAFHSHAEYIINETLIIDLAFDSCRGGAIDLNGESTKIELELAEAPK